MALRKSSTKKKKTDTKVAVKDSTLQVSKVFSKGGEVLDHSDSSEVLEVHSFDASPAHVSISAGITHSPAQFESVKIGVMVTVPTYLEELDDAKAFASGKAAEFLQQELESMGIDPTASAETADDSADEDEDEEETEDGDGEDEDEEELTSDDVLAMSRKELEALIEEDDIDVDPSDFKKSKKGTAELAEAVIEVLSGEEDDSEESEDEEDEDKDSDSDEDSDDDEEDEDSDDEDADDEDDGEVYSQEELEAHSEKELKDIYEAWELGKFPAAKSEKLRKKKAIEAILERQGGE